MENKSFENRSQFKYMIFQLGSELYGTPLIQVREVIENKTPKPVPIAQKTIEGVINLRGEVIGVIDLRKILDIKPVQSLSILVFDTDHGTMGAIIDKCLSVTEIFESDIDQKNNFGTGATGNYFLGVGKIYLGLVTLVSLPEVVRHQT